MEWSRHAVWPRSCPYSLGSLTFTSEMKGWKESMASQYISGNLKGELACALNLLGMQQEGTGPLAVKEGRQRKCHLLLLWVSGATVVLSVTIEQSHASPSVISS